MKHVDPRRLQPLVVDVGASDGLYNSNSYDLITTYGWRGILLEPQEDKLEIAKGHHAARLDRIAFEPCALSEHQGTVVLYGHKNDGDGNTTMNHGASLLALQDSPVQRPVHSISYETFVSVIDLSQVGLLAIDTEGYDHNIICGLFHATKKRPQVIITERYYPLDHRKLFAKTQLLALEYDCVHSNIDQIYIRKDLKCVF